MYWYCKEKFHGNHFYTNTTPSPPLCVIKILQTKQNKTVLKHVLTPITNEYVINPHNIAASSGKKENRQMFVT